MGYLQDTATPGEQIIGVANFSWLYLAFAMTPFWVGLIFVYVAFQFLTHNQLVASHVPPVVMNYGFIAVLVVGIVRYMMMAMPWLTMEIAATTTRVVYSHGVLSRRTEEVAINRLEGVKLNQSFTGRMFNYGSLSLYGVGTDEIILPPISNPMEFRKAVQEAVNMSQSSDANFMGGK
jgi:uncharacterized membrane protein YdbT with pleckstrin-like domain